MSAELWAWVITLADGRTEVAFTTESREGVDELGRNLQAKWRRLQMNGAVSAHAVRYAAVETDAPPSWAVPAPGPVGTAKCWSCGMITSAMEDSETGSFSAPPGGAVGVCTGCAAILIFTDDGAGVREPTTAEYLELSGHESLKRLIREVRGGRRR